VKPINKKGERIRVSKMVKARKQSKRYCRRSIKACRLLEDPVLQIWDQNSARRRGKHRRSCDPIDIGRFGSGLKIKGGRGGKEK